jgi:hypothetical protein
MRALIALLAAVVAVLALPVAASAKEIVSVRTCGAAGCDDVTAIASLAALDGGDSVDPPSSAAPFYRIAVTVKEGRERSRWSFLYVPSAQKVRGDGGAWMHPRATSLRALDRIVSGRRPLPAARLALPATPGEAPAPPPPAAGARVPAAVWAFGAAGAAALVACGLGLVLRRRGPTAA